MTVTVRAATPKDAELIAEFNIRMAMETESKTLDSATVNRGVSQLIANPSNGHYRIAERDGEMAGCLMITYEWSDWRDGNMWWIQSVFVAPEYRGQGVFRSLYEDILSAAKSDENVRCVRLYVERDNVTAQRTYAALGMHETDYRLYEISA